MDSLIALDTASKIVALLGALTSVVLWYQKRRDKNIQEASHEVLKTRLRYVNAALKGVATNIQILVRRCDDPEVSSKELQSMARMARTDVFTALQGVNDTERAVDEWHYGILVKSADASKPNDEAEHDDPANRSPET